MKIDNSIAIPKIKEYKGLGRFSPWIFEPSQRSKVGQKISIISGVPEPAKKRNGVDNMMRHEASKETLFLNQRFNNRMSKNPSAKPIMILGSLIE